MTQNEWMQRLEKYWRSAEWKRKRAARIEIDKHRCRICGATEKLTVHHLPQSYDLIPNESVEDDLITLCRRCHDEVATNLTRRDGYRRRNRPYKLVCVVPENQRRVSNGLARKEVSIEVVGPVGHAQRPDRRPAQQILEVDEVRKLQAPQNR